MRRTFGTCMSFIALLPLLFAATGCTEYWTSTVSRTKPMKDGDVLVTTADLRTTTWTNVNGHRVTCAEPSPDVAKIAAASMDSSLSGSASSIGNVVSPEIALTLAMSRSEAMAQLGQRIATVQLLRDGMFRACEAYANGAIDGTAYSAILSRYDKLMITMLLGEFAANSTTRVLPVALTGNGQANGTAVVVPDQAQIDAINNQIASEKQTNDDLNSQIATLRTSGTTPTAADTQQLSALQA